MKANHMKAIRQSWRSLHKSAEAFITLMEVPCVPPQKRSPAKAEPFSKITAGNSILWSLTLLGGNQQEKSSRKSASAPSGPMHTTEL